MNNFVSGIGFQEGLIDGMETNGRHYHIDPPHPLEQSTTGE